jgi:hypothetical protein
VDSLATIAGGAQPDGDTMGGWRGTAPLSSDPLFVDPPSRSHDVFFCGLSAPSGPVGWAA